MGISKIKILNKHEMEGYAKCGYYELYDICHSVYRGELNGNKKGI